MRYTFVLYFLFICNPVLFANATGQANDSLLWKNFSRKGYTIYYTTDDENQLKKLNAYLESGVNDIVSFFGNAFKDTFNVYLFPDRSSLDRQWQKDWGDPKFRSECWMVASGVAHRLDILSPNAWKKESCDHNADDSTEVRKIIWHELVHVFHGQYNPDHNFSYIEKLDWLVEGVATFVSGQLDEGRSQRVHQMIIENKTPSTLDDFWKGQDKYGLSGSMAAYIDNKYGRKKLFELLKQTTKENVLKLLAVSERQLLSGWKEAFK